jgi:hypothetical protein
MVAVFLILLTQVGPGPLAPMGRLEHPLIREASGIVASRRYPGTFWVHNDSGNRPALFAVRRDGSLVREFEVAAPNLDWEDIALDDAGQLYLGDIGNNGAALPLRAIYRLDEPDPSRPALAPLAVTRTTYYRFEGRGRFDAESLFIEGRHAVIISKRRDGKDAELFSIPIDPPAPIFRPALPARLGQLPEFMEPATGADLSPDGQDLAVAGIGVARVYRRARDGTWMLRRTFRFEARDIEAIAWDGADLILVGEGRGVYRISDARGSGPVER